MLHNNVPNLVARSHSSYSRLCPTVLSTERPPVITVGITVAMASR